MKWESSLSSNHIRSLGFFANGAARKGGSGVGKDFASLLAGRQILPAGAPASSEAKSTSSTSSNEASSLLFAVSSLNSGAAPAASNSSVAISSQTAPQRLPDERVPTLPAYMKEGFDVGKGPMDEGADVEALQARKTTIEKQIASFEQSEWTYNDLWKSVALAGASPPGYISPNVSPGIRQGSGVTDQVDGVTIPRADLYYGHDFAAQTRQILRNGGTPTLPPELATNPDVKEKFDAYVAAFKSMPSFAGQVGSNSATSPLRRMSMLDAMAIQNELNSINAYLPSM